MSAEQVTSARVGAVIVTHEPGNELTKCIDALIPQVSHLVLVDNDSRAATLEQLVPKHESIEVIRLPNNLGVGAAHNVGVRRAVQRGATHVLLLDQDSIPAPDMVHELLRAEASLLSGGTRIGAVGPVFEEQRLGKSWPFYRMSRFGVRTVDCREDGFAECDFLISSGKLVRVEVLKDVGSMNESYFLEHIDTEWCLRARHRGYSIYGVGRARMSHHLGDGTVRVPLTHRQVQLYPAYRHYYLFRNSLLLWREPHARLAWKLNEVRRLFSRLIFFSIFVAPRWQRLKFMLLGLWHGILGKSGRGLKATRIELSARRRVLRR